VGECSGMSPDGDRREMEKADHLDDVSDRVAALARQPVSPSSSEWEAIERTTREVVAPAIAAYGPDAVISALVAAKADPYVAAVLVAISGPYHPPEGHDFRVTDLFSDEEIVRGALSFLEKFPDAGLADGNWAWTTLWNLWEQVEPAAQARLVKHLIEEAPWDDQVLWMIGDGPLSEVANEPAHLAVIEGDEAIREKVARIRRLVEVDWPHGSADP